MENWNEFLSGPYRYSAFDITQATAAFQKAMILLFALLLTCVAEETVISVD